MNISFAEKKENHKNSRFVMACINLGFLENPLEQCKSVATGPNTQILCSALKEDICKRSTLIVKGLKNQSRILAQYEHDSQNMKIPFMNTDCESKKRKCVRSAFISRQSQRNYGRLLAEFVQKSEDECNAARKICENFIFEIQTLTIQVEQLNIQLDKLVHGRKNDSENHLGKVEILPKIASSSNQKHAVEGTQVCKSIFDQGQLRKASFPKTMTHIKPKKLTRPVSTEIELDDPYSERSLERLDDLLGLH